jgi:hypothetical protein
MNLQAVVHARRRCQPRPSWVVLFAKAYSLVAVEMPRLRQSFLSFPYPRLYEHPESVASIAVEREFQGEEAPFFGQLRGPESRSLLDLDRRLRHFKSASIEEVSEFRRALRFGRLWRPLRRLAWWYGLNGSGRCRARRFGTFGISVYSSLGVNSLHPIAPVTAILNYGPIGPSGRVDVRLIYDHRVLDGAVVGRALVRLEEVLTGPVVEELLGMACQAFPAGGGSESRVVPRRRQRAGRPADGTHELV